MDVRLLEAFRAVVDHRSVTDAAAAMGVTQPAVSAQIARLEQELGFSLFDRGNGRLKPTAEGLLFYAEAEKALTGIDRLAQAAEQIRTAQTGRLVIASHPSAAISLLPRTGLGLHRRAAGRARTPAVTQLRRHQPAAADRELRHRHRRAAGRRDRRAASRVSACAAWRSCRRGTSWAPAPRCRRALLSGHPVVAPGANAADVGAAGEGLRRRRRGMEPGRRGRILRQRVRPGRQRRGLVDRRSAVGADLPAPGPRRCAPSSRRSPTRSACSARASGSLRSWPSRSWACCPTSSTPSMREDMRCTKAPIWPAVIAADRQLWPDFLAICDCGGRLAGTDKRGACVRAGREPRGRPPPASAADRSPCPTADGRQGRHRCRCPVA